MRIKILRLWDIPQGSKLKVELKNEGLVEFTFHHLDGMYSYCTDENGRVLNLSGATPLIKVGNCYQIRETK